MNPLLDDASVAAGILAITQRDGVRAVTARSLAGHLHVSLGALYNYMTSMPDAMQNADRHVYAAISEAIGTVSDLDARRQSLLAWGHAELPLVDLIADLGRTHAPLPSVFLQLMPVTAVEFPKTRQAAEIIRSFLGLWRAGSPDLTSADLDTVAEALATSLASYDPTTDYSSMAIPVDALQGLAVDLIAVRPHDQIDDAVRVASVEVLLEGEWSFRKLQNKTGLPLARLNRMSPRDEHVMVAVGDIVGGIVLKHLTEGEGVVELMRSIVSTVGANADLLIGTQLPFLSLSLANNMTDDSGLWATTPMDKNQVMLACGLGTAVLHAGYSNRDADPVAAAASIPLTIDIAERAYVRLTGS